MRLLNIAASALLVAASAPTLASHPEEKQTVVEVAKASSQHTTLVAAVTAADLAPTLGATGPYTVFAPTDAAFAELPEGTVATLLKPENKTMLQAVLGYHVVPGKVTAADLVKQIEAGGEARLKTVAGGELVARLADGKVVLTDATGGSATVVAADLAASNGVIHVTDAVSLPG